MRQLVPDSRELIVPVAHLRRHFPLEVLKGKGMWLVRGAGAGSMSKEHLLGILHSFLGISSAMKDLHLMDLLLRSSVDV